ncbi:restriction endonuclease subunit S [Nicoliella spurrieriana]|uniref:Restriction endonuclease subunit S n=1 Tax=Nicoliella spurrieriana TaxID=2925830 RepID=A0A976RS78_9LACO|nr:restriction endonuclease subunit S [Nicoliella spurrieriana]
MWKKTTLNKLSKIISGGTPNTNNISYWNGSINWFSPMEIGKDIFVYNSQKKITTLGLQKSSAKILPVGTILFTSRAGIGKTAILSKEACTNQGFQSIVPKKKLLDSYFTFSITNKLKKYGNKMGSGSTFNEISGKQMGKMKIFIPEFHEQQKIGSFFQKLDQLIELQSQKVIHLKQLKRGFLQKLYPAKGEILPLLRFNKFNGNWNLDKLNKLGKSYGGLTGKNKDDFGHGNGKYITYLNVYNNAIARKDGVKSIEVDYKQNCVNKHDILFTISSETPEEVGLSSIWDYNENDVYLNSFSFGYRPLIHFDNYFLGYYLRSDQFRSSIFPLAQGISRYNISKNNLLKLKIIFPSIKEQQKIGSLFQNLDQQISLQQSKLEHLKQLKKVIFKICSSKKDSFSRESASLVYD